MLYWTSLCHAPSDNRTVPGYVVAQQATSIRHNGLGVRHRRQHYADQKLHSGGDIIFIISGLHNNTSKVTLSTGNRGVFVSKQ